MAKPFIPSVKPGSYMANPRKGYIPFVGRGGYTKQNHVWPPEPDPIWETVVGNPVSFETIKQWPLRQLKVAFSPVQDLHGYDAPWPAGGGKNKFDKDAITDNVYLSTTTGLPEPASQYCITDYIPVKNGVTVYIPQSDSVRRWFYSSDKTPTTYLQNGGNQAFTPTEDGFIRVSIDKRTISIDTYQIEYGSSPTSYAPYSNECPISGWDSLHVYDDPLYAGVIEWNQLFNYVGVSPSQAQGITCINNNDGTFTCDGVSTSRVYKLLVTLATIVGHKYYLGGCPSGGDITKYVMNIDAETGSVDTGSGAIFTSTRASSQLYIVIGKDYPVSNLVFTPQLCDLTEMFGAGNEPATVEEFKALFPHDYYPYNAGTETLVGTVNGMDTRSISISLGQTVYSGYVDVISGVGEITHGIITKNGSEDWTRTNSGTYYGRITGMQSGDAMSGISNWLSNVGKESSMLGFRLGANDNRIYLYSIEDNISDVTDITSFKAYLAQNPLNVVYPLATPIPIQLTPQEVESLAGDNTMWTDGDSLTVEYRSN